ncbi:MAG TPA: MBL fold metallo-hydrolase, partial [Candidatus Paceibacterota bacterium]|nr:MBL fold metallo-hydrolase [Candidatus Paceibacterota bacterium]
MKELNRRSFMQRGGLAGLSLLALGSIPNRAVADPEPAAESNNNTSAASAEPAIYPFQLGGTETFVIQDGTFIFPGIQPSFAPEAKPAELDELLKRNFLPNNHLALSLNVLVIKAASGVMIFDAGAGSGLGSATGKLVRGLAKLGIAPKDVKTIYVTHAHLDHIGGLVDASGAP